MMCQSRDFRNPSNASRTACERDRTFPLSIRSSSLSSMINGRLTVTFAARWLVLLDLLGNIDTPHHPHSRFAVLEPANLPRRRIIVSAIRPPQRPARIDSIGNPGTAGPTGTVVGTDPVQVDVLLLIVEVTMTVVVPGTLSGPYFRIKP